MRRAPLVLAAVSLFLAALLGGQVPVDAQPLDPGTPAWLAALLGGPEAPVLSWAWFALFGLGALAICAASHRVLQLPKTSIGVTAVLFAALLVLAVPTSPFRMAAVVALVGWLLALSGLWIAVAVAGRSTAPRFLLAALWAGTVVQACIAVLEYGSMRAVDPSWRVFGTWVNPNALAALLQIGWLLGLALLATAARPWNLAAFAGQAVVGLALLLTQSKGVLLTAGIGTAVYAGAVLAGRTERPSRVRALLPAAVAVVIFILLGLGLRASQPSTGPSALGRVARAEQTSEQSSGFRLLLWKGALQLAAQHPAGIGLGAYRFRSAEPGLTTQTYYAHNSYLQLAAEASWLAAAALAALLLGWAVEALKALRRVPWDHAVWRAAVFAAVLAVAAHSLIDSDLHYVGLGYLFFALLGIGLAMAPDGVAPELTPQWMRIAAIVKPALFWVLLAMLGWQRAIVSGAVGLAAAGRPEEARERLRQARSLAPFDAEPAYLLGQLEPPGPERERWLQEAVRLAPTTRHIRALAREQAASGRQSVAVATLSEALRYDPNNLPTWSLILKLQREAGDLASAERSARKMVAIEQTPYFQIRALPEIVPVETCEARLFLAERSTDPRKAVDWLDAALDLYRRYLETTVPRVEQAAAQGATLGGETAERARETMELAAKAARRLAQAYRALGRAADAEAAESEAGRFEEAAVRLSSR